MSPQKQLTRIERALRTLNFQPTDRPPIIGGRIRHVEFLTEAAEISLDTFWKQPKQVCIDVSRQLGADAVFGPTVPLQDSEIGAATHIHSDKSVQSPEDVLSFTKRLPSLAAIRSEFDHQQAVDSFARMMKAGQAECGDMLFVPFAGAVCEFHPYYERFGMENFLMALALYPEDMERLFEISAEQATLANRAIVEAIRKEGLLPFLWFGQDICGNQGPMASPRLLAAIYFPHAKRSIQPIVEAGVKIIWHSDGNIMPILDQLIDMGVDGFQSLQEDVGVDIEKIATTRTQRGELPIIVGSVSNDSVLPFGSVKDVEREVEKYVQLAEKRGGGLLLSPSSSIASEVPKRNIYALFAYARQRMFKSYLQDEIHP